MALIHHTTDVGATSTFQMLFNKFRAVWLNRHRDDGRGLFSSVCERRLRAREDDSYLVMAGSARYGSMVRCSRPSCLAVEFNLNRAVHRLEVLAAVWALQDFSVPCMKMLLSAKRHAAHQLRRWEAAYHKEVVGFARHYRINILAHANSSLPASI